MENVAEITATSGVFSRKNRQNGKKTVGFAGQMWYNIDERGNRYMCGIKVLCVSVCGLIIQAAYYEQHGEIGKDIETCQTVLKIGKHYWDENQNLVAEISAGLNMWIWGQILLGDIFEKNNMVEEKKKLEAARKIANERIDKIEEKA